MITLKTLSFRTLHTHVDIHDSYIFKDIIYKVLLYSNKCPRNLLKGAY